MGWDSPDSGGCVFSPVAKFVANPGSLSTIIVSSIQIKNLSQTQDLSNSVIDSN